jgi:hypothetical protein
MAELIFNPNKDSVYVRFSNGKNQLLIIHWVKQFQQFMIAT